MCVCVCTLVIYTDKTSYTVFIHRTCIVCSHVNVIGVFSVTVLVVADRVLILAYIDKTL